MDASFWAIWWVWGAAALTLAIVEILLPGFVFLGFAIGAAIVALLLLAGAGFTLPPLLLIFAALSLAAWLVMRKFFALPKGQVKTFNHDIND